MDRRTARQDEELAGYFAGPCVFDGVEPQMAIAREEIFGPVAGIMRADSLDEAIAQHRGPAVRQRRQHLHGQRQRRAPVQASRDRGQHRRQRRRRRAHGVLPVRRHEGLVLRRAAPPGPRGRRLLHRPQGSHQQVVLVVRAAVFSQPNQPMTVEELVMPEPHEHEVRVKVAACGVCHTDLHVLKGEVAFPTPGCARPRGLRHRGRHRPRRYERRRGRPRRLLVHHAVRQLRLLRPWTRGPLRDVLRLQPPQGTAVRRLDTPPPAQRRTHRHVQHGRARRVRHDAGHLRLPAAGERAARGRCHRRLLHLHRLRRRAEPGRRPPRTEGRRLRRRRRWHAGGADGARVRRVAGHRGRHTRRQAGEGAGDGRDPRRQRRDRGCPRPRPRTRERAWRRRGDRGAGLAR